jgi:uncharacterized membrane protein YidH (DUF202 family)
MAAKVGSSAPAEPAWDEGDASRPGDRTALAWVRTALIPAGIGCAVLRFQGFESVTGHEVLGAAYLALAVMIWFAGQIRFSRSRLQVSPTPSPWLLGTVAVASGCLALATAVLILV